MNALDLYKFVNDNKIEYHKSMSDENEIYLFVNNRLIDKFNKLLGLSIIDDGGLNCVMKDGYIAFEMKYICEYYDIEITEVFDFDEVEN